jgi:transcriptional regulator of arginine metabolism
MANAAAAAIDAMHNSSIVGSVAGDDTVLCVLRTEEKASEFSDLIGKTISE